MEKKQVVDDPLMTEIYALRKELSASAEEVLSLRCLINRLRHRIDSLEATNKAISELRNELDHVKYLKKGLSEERERNSNRYLSLYEKYLKACRGN